MTKRALILGSIAAALLSGCAPVSTHDDSTDSSSRRIVSLDYCADQFVLALADKEEIVGLSIDSTKDFSYLREAAKQFPQIRPRTEDILLAKPDIIVRSYGGEPGAVAFYTRLGIDVVQIGYANKLSDIPAIIKNVAAHLNATHKSQALIDNMNLNAPGLMPRDTKSVLYLTSKGAVAGTSTIIDDVIRSAGYHNFESTRGWRSLPLESLVFARPDIIATGFFESGDLTLDRWTPTRHPIIERQLAQSETINIPGAWTACSAWFLTDAVDALKIESSNE